MIQRVYVEKKENGFVVIGEDESPEVNDKEIVIQGWSPSHVGEAVIQLFKKPRKSPVKKGATE